MIERTANASLQPALDHVLGGQRPGGWRQRCRAQERAKKTRSLFTSDILFLEPSEAVASASFTSETFELPADFNLGNSLGSTLVSARNIDMSNNQRFVIMGTGSSKPSDLNVRAASARAQPCVGGQKTQRHADQSCIDE